MAIKDKWYPEREFDIETALLREMQDDMSADGTLERLQNELCSTQQVLARFMVMHIKNVQQLNNIVGYDKYTGE